MDFRCRSADSTARDDAARLPVFVRPALAFCVEEPRVAERCVDVRWADERCDEPVRPLVLRVPRDPDFVVVPADRPEDARVDVFRAPVVAFEAMRTA